MLTAIDWIIIIVYFAFVLGIGVALKRYMRSGTDFLTAVVSQRIRPVAIAP